MKRILLLLIATFTLSCCNNDDDKPIAEIDKLPPATQTGANTAGCLVNGQAFTTKGYFPGGSGLTCSYSDGLNFTLGISENINGTIRSVLINSKETDIHNYINIPFSLNIVDNNSKFGEYIIYNSDFSQNYFSTNSHFTGQLTITYHDFNNAIISGTFWFDAVNNNNEKVEIREGRFDMQY